MDTSDWDLSAICIWPIHENIPWFKGWCHTKSQISNWVGYGPHAFSADLRIDPINIIKNVSVVYKQSYLMIQLFPEFDKNDPPALEWWDPRINYGPESNFFLWSESS